MNYTEALEYIHGINWTFCKPGLERIGELCERLGHPEKNLKFVHVAGTNGKGSFCSMLSSVLTAAGYRTGLYTSPYILRFNERMKINGVDIADEELAEITEYVKPIADGMKDKPTEFELISAIAFEYFKRQKANVVVLEAGMGGRLDSTNIIESSLLSVITGISLDHVAFLGDTVEKIALEKAGIIKCGSPVLFGGTDEGAKRVISEAAKEKGSDFHTVDYSVLNIKKADLDGSVFSYKGGEDLKINMLGLYQPKNASVVLEAIEILNKRGLAISKEAVAHGFEAARWPARFEIINRDPLIIFDGGHNAEGIESAVKSIKHYFGKEKVLVLTGVLKDKDYISIAKNLASVAKGAFTITPDNQRALDAKEYKTVLENEGVKAEACGSIKEALSAAYDTAKKENTPLVCLGSLYTYIDIYKELEKITK